MKPLKPKFHLLLTTSQKVMFKHIETTDIKNMSTMTAVFGFSPSQCVHPGVVSSDVFVYGFFECVLGQRRGRSHLITEELFL